MSKVFELCILDRYRHFLKSSDNQFGFKKGLSCSHAVYTIRNVVDSYVNGGSAVNLCALDLTKAFDKMNHFGLFIKLMDRLIPTNLLKVLEHWFSVCYTCVRWNGITSDFFKLKCGIRQGGVLSPHLFAVFIDDIIKTVGKRNIGCKSYQLCASIFLYADDILLMAPSVQCLQKLINIVENDLAYLDMAINTAKSFCLRIGPRFDSPCANMTDSEGNKICWTDNCRYLGV